VNCAAHVIVKMHRHDLALVPVASQLKSLTHIMFFTALGCTTHLVAIGNIHFLANIGGRR
jgi:hypothetical protein